jgi:hypothetical protein
MRCLRLVFIALATLVAWVPVSQAQPATGTLFTSDGTFLYTVDLTSGTATQLGQLGTQIVAIAWHNGTLYGLATDGFLYTIDPGTAACALVGNTEVLTTQGVLCAGLTAYNGQLYTQAIDYLAPGSSALYSINPSTATVTTIGPIGSSTYVFTLAANSQGTFYGSEAANLPSAFYSLSSSTGEATSIGQTVVGYTGLAFDPSDNLYGVIPDASGNTATIYLVDPTTGNGTPVVDAQVYAFGIAFVK